MIKVSIGGVGSIRSVLRSIPDAAREELVAQFRVAGDNLLSRAKAETPTKTGALRAALGTKFTVTKGQNIILRLGLLTKRNNRRYFYGFILDQGRRAQTVTAKRISADGTTRKYLLRVGAIDRERYNFLFGRRRDFQVNELPQIRTIWARILHRASRGVYSR